MAQQIFTVLLDTDVRTQNWCVGGESMHVLISWYECEGVLLIVFQLPVPVQSPLLLQLDPCFKLGGCQPNL